jgi:hypothetical protein
MLLGGLILLGLHLERTPAFSQQCIRTTTIITVKFYFSDGSTETYTSISVREVCTPATAQ